MFGFKPKATVLMIHEEFDSASARLLLEANRILSTAQPLPSSAVLAKVASLGFTNMKMVTESTEILRTREQAKNVAELVEHYSRWYPQNKFITHEEVTQICKKYGLLHGFPDSFIGDMPEKNQRELIAFKCRDEDKVYVYYSSLISTRIEDGRDYRHRYDGNPNSGMRSISSFTIVATPSEFDTNKKEITSEFTIAERDPIVLYMVFGGFLVVTKWGAEAKIPGIASPNSN